MATLLALATMLAQRATAHTVNPTALTLRAGTYDYFTVTDQGTCAAAITVTTTRPDLIDLCLDGGSGAICGCGTNSKTSVAISETFYVCASPTDANGQPWQTTQFGSVSVCWVGQGVDINGNPCTEDNCSTLPVNISITVTPDPETVGQGPQAGHTPDPIHTRTGELYFTEPPDLVLRGPLPLVFQRYYASRLVAEGNASSELEANWLHNFSWKLTPVGNNVEVVTPRGRVLVFEHPPLSGPNSFALLTPLDRPYALVADAVEYRLGDQESGLTYAFDFFGRLVRIEDANGNALDLTYAAGKLSQVSDGLGRTLGLTYLAGGQLDTVSDGTRAVAFGYGAAALESVVDAAGGTTSYVYDAVQPAAALLVARTDASGVTQNVQAFDASDRVATQTNAYGGVLALAYPAGSSGDTTLTNALGNSSLHTHASSGELTDVTDEAGNSYGYTYDAQGRRKSWTDRLGGKTSWTFDATSGRIASMTAANGAKTSFGYAPRSAGGITFYELATVTAPGGATQTFARDAAGNVTTYTDADGGVWSLAYSASGQVITAANPLGGTHAFTYAVDGDLATWTDPSGDATSFSYDGLHRLVSITWPDGSVSSAGYDALDRLLDVTDGTGAVTSFVWDAAGRLVQRTDADGNPVAWLYDSMGWLQARTDGSDGGGATSTLSRDLLGQIFSTIDASGASTSYGYDAVGNLNTLTTPSGGTWTLDLDKESVIDHYRDALGSQWDVTTNSMGAITLIKSPEGRIERANYDGLGRMTRWTAPGGRSVDLAYTPRGLLAGTYGPLGISTFYQRNPAGQVAVATDANGEDWTSTYDVDGRRTSFSDPLGRTTGILFDALDRVAQVDYADGTTLSVTRDLAGRPISTVSSTGETYATTYAPSGRIASAHGVSFGYDSVGNVIDSNGIAIGRDPAGRMTSLTLGPGKTITYDWGGDELVDSIIDWLGGTTTFTYLATGSLQTITFPNGLAITSSYDADGLLVGVDFGAQGSIQLQRGSSGQVIQANRALPLVAAPALSSALCVYDPASQEASSTYNLRGQTLTSGAFAYTWDALGIRSLTDGVGTATFEHDAFGQLIRRSLGGADEDLTWIYGLRQPALGIRSTNGAPMEAVVPYVDGTPLYTIDWNLGLRSYLHWDERGSLVFRSDDAGAVTDAYAYDEFGFTIGETGPKLNDLFTFKGKLGWLREDFSAAGVAHYHHGGGFYRADQARDLAPELDPDHLLWYRASPYSAENDRDELAAEDFDDDERSDLENVLNGLALSIGVDATAPASNRATPRASGGFELLLSNHRRGSARVIFNDAFLHTKESLDLWRELREAFARQGHSTRLSRMAIADNGLAYGQRIPSASSEAARGGLLGSELDGLAPADSASAPPEPTNRVTYFSPAFAGFHVPVVYGGSSEGVFGEFDADDVSIGFGLGIGAQIDF